MRRFSIVSLLFLTACGPNSSGSLIELYESSQHLSLDRAQSGFEEADLQLNDSTQISLMNTDFQTARRLEHEVKSNSVSAKWSLDDISTIAETQALRHYPNTKLKFVKAESGRRYAYVTFQQIHESREIVGAKIIVRMTQTGDWRTMSSTLIHPDLLENKKPTLASPLNSEKYYWEPHQILHEDSVWYPKKSENEKLEIHPATQWAIRSTDAPHEFYLWVDQETEELLGAHLASITAETFSVQGKASPNAPGDTPLEFNLPFVSAFVGEDKIEANAMGVFQKNLFHGSQAKIKLENRFLSVVDNKRSVSELPLDLSQDIETVHMNDGASLEETNIYYWIMETRKFLKEKLKYEGLDYQLVAIANFGERLDNAFFMPLTKTLQFGAGNIFLKNTALSRDIIIHEFGHAFTHAIYGLQGGYEFSSMNEAFSDYLAATVTDNPEIAEGAMHERTGMPYLRNVENELHFSKNFLGKSFHTDSQLFSGALWNLRESIGQQEADVLIHEARLAQAKTVSEFLRELLVADENTDDQDWKTHSPYFKEILVAFQSHGLWFHTRFTEYKEDLTIPWKPKEDDSKETTGIAHL